VTLKALVSGAAAAVAIAGAAAGVTSIASSDVMNTPRVAPVVWDIPLPEQPPTDVEGPLLATLQALGAPGLSASKAAYIQGGIGRIEGRVADSKLREAQAEGKFPLSFSLKNVQPSGAGFTADVTATAANGGVASQNIAFVPGPSPTGWQMSKQSLMALMSAVG
jgi:hypothetical protein